MIVIAFDPGKTNHGYCVAGFKLLKYRVLENGKFKTTITNPNLSPRQQCDAYAKRVTRLYGKYPDAQLFISERFLSRGLRGALGECIAMMNTCITMAIPKAKVRADNLKLVAAGVWKNEVNKTLVLKEYYKHTAVSSHQVDAFLMAAWFYYVRHLNDKLLFHRFLTTYKTFTKQLERTARFPLREMRRGRMSSDSNRDRRK